MTEGLKRVDVQPAAQVDSPALEADVGGAMQRTFSERAYGVGSKVVGRLNIVGQGEDLLSTVPPAAAVADALSVRVLPEMQRATMISKEMLNMQRAEAGHRARMDLEGGK